MKTVLIPNSNKKLLCKYFLHVSEAPKNNITESSLPVKLLVKESPHNTFEAEMVAFTRCKLYELNSLITYAASAMTRDAFIIDYMVKHPGSDFGSPVAIYVYRKC